MTQGLEELGARAEVRLLQPAEINRSKSVGSSAWGCFQTREKTAFTGVWQAEQPASHHFTHTHAITCYVLGHYKLDFASSGLLPSNYTIRRTGTRAHGKALPTLQDSTERPWFSKISTKHVG